MKTVAVAGHFNPLHVGHLHLFREAKKLGDTLVVIVANDEQAHKKSGSVFMPLGERMEIVKAIKWVDDVYASIDTDSDVRKTLQMVKPDVFASGCDELHSDAIAERQICEELLIETHYNVGSKKVRSSSEYLKQYANTSK